MVKDISHHALLVRYLAKQLTARISPAAQAACVPEVLKFVIVALAVVDPVCFVTNTVGD